MNRTYPGNNHRCRIVLTGGPGGGKTTAADLFRREIGEKVVIVPEAATMMFSGGFPRYTERDAVCSAQRAIYHVQRNLEQIQAAKYADRILLCDRGSVDGAAYWPDDSDRSFFEEMGTTLEDELSHYDGVIFFETAAAGGMGIEGGNPVRSESLPEAVKLDRILHDLWSQHPNFVKISHNESFLEKISLGLKVLDEMVRELK
ncbi:MAG: AAA family ATPase [Verrucomicrobiales bacterium]|nr:AAA family ATPase [Verrucomicrobiales bacterium]